MSRTIAKALNQGWEEMVSTIPDDLEANAQEHGALQRHRGFQKASDLLRLILMDATLLSLRNTALWAACLGVCVISGKLCNNGSWPVRAGCVTCWLCC